MRHNARNRRVTRGQKRSPIEDRTREFLDEQGIDYAYEKHRIPFNPKQTFYKPDWVLPNGIIIETKGWFQPKERTKHLLIKKQHPILDIRFVFERPNNKINKTSKTTYADWCEKHGFPWASSLPPVSWLSEVLSPDVVEETHRILKEVS